MDIELEDGRTKSLWFHQLEVVEQGETLPARNGTSCVGRQGMVARVENETAQEAELPKHYCLGETDPDVVVLRRDDGTFVAAFSARDPRKRDSSRPRGKITGR